ncbi:MAG: hypothetical protein WD834_08080, partial [Actinomycetota bacterium]
MSTIEISARAVDDRRNPAPMHPPNRRWTRFILPAYTILMILYLASPIFVMILYGFNDIPGD